MKKKGSGKKSRYHGVSWCQKQGKWHVARNYKRKAYWGGQHEDEEEAARASDNLVRKLKATNILKLNFPRKDEVIKDAKRSQYVGVTWCKNLRKWQVSRTINGKSKNGGYFLNEVEAARRSDELVHLHANPNSNLALNFPNDIPNNIKPVIKKEKYDDWNAPSTYHPPPVYYPPVPDLIRYNPGQYTPASPVKLKPPIQDPIYMDHTLNLCGDPNVSMPDEDSQNNNREVSRLRFELQKCEAEKKKIEELNATQTDKISEQSTLIRRQNLQISEQAQKILNLEQQLLMISEQLSKYMNSGDLDKFGSMTD